MQHSASFKITGMQLDTAESAFDSKYSYKNKNIRIISKLEDGLLLSATNEKGTLPIQFYTEYIEGQNNDSHKTSVEGTIIGQTTIDDTLILFSTTSLGETPDYIYKATLIKQSEFPDTEEPWKLELLYNGNLEFSIEHPIEALPYWESDNIKKVYWVDGKNQPRHINICLSQQQLENANFDFIQNNIDDLDIKVNISPVYSGGYFTPGTIQFVCTYIDIQNSETYPFYISDLYYIHNKNSEQTISAISPDSTCNISYQVNIDTPNLDIIASKYKKIRIYYIHRSTENGTSEISYVEYSINNIQYDTSTTQSFNCENLNNVIVKEYDSNETNIVDIIGFEPGYSGIVGTANIEQQVSSSESVLISNLGVDLASDAHGSRKWRDYYNDNIIIKTVENSIIKRRTLKKYIDYSLDKYGYAPTIESAFGSGSTGNILSVTIDFTSLINNWDETSFTFDIYLLSYSLKFPVIKLDFTDAFPVSSDSTKYSLSIIYHKDANNIEIEWIQPQRDDNLNFAPSAVIYQYITSNIDTSNIKVYLNNIEYLKLYNNNINSYIRNRDNENIEYFSIDDNIIKAHSANNAVVNYNLSIPKLLYKVSNSSSVYTNDILFKILNTYIINPKTLECKDNTLFFGNYEIKNTTISEQVETAIQDLIQDVQFVIDDSKTIKLPKINNENKKYYYDSQLDKSSSQIKHFKYDEHYRIGLRLLDQYNNYTVVYLGNKTNNVKPWYDRKNNCIQVPYIKLELNEQVKNRLLDLGIVKIEPLVSFPSIEESRWICQGVLSPTIFNCARRSDKSLYAQASWTHRPIILDGGSEHERTDAEIYKRLGFTKSLINESTLRDQAITHRGTICRYKDLDVISSVGYPNSEIATTLHNGDEDFYKSDVFEQELDGYTEIKDLDYLIDQNIVTLHSPELELSEKLYTHNYSNAKLRIIGILPIHSNTAYRNWAHSGSLGTYGWYIYDNGTDLTTYINDDINSEFVNIGYKIDDIGAFRKMISDNIFKAGVNAILDDSDLNRKNTMSYSTKNLKAVSGYAVYLFGQSGRICPNVTAGTNTNCTLWNKNTAELDYKIISNLQYSHTPWYFPNEYITDIYTPVTVYDQNLYKINTYDGEVSYYGSVNYSENVEPRSPRVLNITSIYYYTDPDYKIKFKSFPTHTTYKLQHPLYYFDNYKQDNFIGNTWGHVSWNMGNIPYDSIKKDASYTNPNGNWEFLSTLGESSTPISVSYSSTPHVVFGLKDQNDIRKILPKLHYSDSNTTYFCNSKSTTAWYHSNQENINMDWEDRENNLYGYNKLAGVHNPRYGFLYLGELYRDIQLNYISPILIPWITAGPIVKINTEDTTTIKWVEGDTYLQRYDNLKVYPPNISTFNGVVDIFSFMCETRINIDGRYDRNRGLKDNTIVANTNFNLINNAYTQANNYFTYNYIESEKRNNTKYYNQITWGLTKIPNAEVDNWVNINLASVLNLDGKNGELSKLINSNNTLIAFQENAVCEILYNTRTQLSTTTGTPIEIGNSGKVDGYRVVANKGTSNKYHILKTPNNLYFIDATNKELYNFTDLAKAMSSVLRVSSWFTKINPKLIWKPQTSDNSYVLQYDYKNQDLYIISKEECLGISEVLGSAQSFYSYEGVNSIFNIEECTYCIKDNSIYKMHAGEYNTFFDKKEPYYIEYIVNDNPTVTKIFDTIEYLGDVFTYNNINKKYDILNNEDTFDILSIKNEYQEGIKEIHTVNENTHMYNDLKRKFRQWRAIIPRELGTRNRIVNPWVKLKIEKKYVGNEKAVLHFLNVKYSTIP